MDRQKVLFAFIVAYTVFVVINAATQYIDAPDVRLLSPVFLVTLLLIGSKRS